MSVITIGINGKIGSGKDTLANMIVDILTDHTARIVSFADPLKLEAYEAMRDIVPGLELEHFYDRTKKGRYRTLLQWWGTEFRRYDDKDYWITKFKEYVKSLDLENEQVVVIVPDMRFINEAEAVDTTVLILRNNYLDDSYVEHISERELDDYPFDFAIENNRDKNALYAEAKLLCYKLNLL